MDTLTFYVVRNKEGKYLRAKGYNGYGDSWVTLDKAKVYARKGGATGQITFWATKYPDYGIPELVPLVATLGDPIDQTERLAKSKRDKLQREIQRAENYCKWAEIEYKKHVQYPNPYETKYMDYLREVNKLKKALENL